MRQAQQHGEQATRTGAGGSFICLLQVPAAWACNSCVSFAIVSSCLHGSLHVLRCVLQRVSHACLQQSAGLRCYLPWCSLNTNMDIEAQPKAPRPDSSYRKCCMTALSKIGAGHPLHLQARICQAMSMADADQKLVP